MVCAQSLGHADRETKRASSRIPAGDDVPAGTLAVVRSSLALRCSTEQNALHTLIHQRHLTPSCGGQAPTAKRTLDPARTIRGELDPRPGIREQPGSMIRTCGKYCRSMEQPGPLCFACLARDGQCCIDRLDERSKLWRACLNIDPHAERAERSAANRAN